MLETLDAPAIRRWSQATAELLELHRVEIDELNVFPVPDGDTGTNLALTARAAADTLAADGCGDPAQALAVLARGAVLGARGNSGVILSQMLRGLAEAAARPDARFGAATLREALACAARRAYESVNEPVEGTMLSVAQAASDAASSEPGSRDLGGVVTAAASAAARALVHTPEQLPALARAGVVDAGGRGVVLLIEALAAVVTEAEQSPAELPRTARSESALVAVRETGSGEFGYEVQYLLEATDDGVTALRPVLAALGDSLVVVGTGDGIWNVHVHVNDVGAAIEAAVETGRPYRITVTRFADQFPSAAGAKPTRERTTAIVAVASGGGLAHLLAAEGVSVVDGWVGSGPSTRDLLEAVHACGTTHVVLLPNAAEAFAAAEAAANEARREGIRVSVVPTRSPVQGLAAIAVHDASRRFDDDVVAMTGAAVATRWAEVTVAQGESLTSVGTCQPGDILGLIDGEVVVIGSGVGAVAQTVLDRLVGIGAELVTIVVGAQADTSDVDLLAAHLTATAPLVDVVVFDGGQPNYPFLIGAE